jgi:hypothetical protein
MVKLVDTLASGASGSDPVEVQLLFRPHFKEISMAIKTVHAITS